MIRHYLKLLWKRKGKNAFLFAELVLVLWVLIGAFSLAMHKYKFYAQPLGFDWQGMYRIYYSQKLDSATIDRMKQELLSFPEVEAVSFSVNVSPYLGNTWGNGNDLNGMSFNSYYLHADEDYAKTWNIPFYRGHFYTKEDLAGKYTPIVVNKLFVDRYLQGKEPLGYRFQFWAGAQVEIVGVMSNFRFQGDFAEEYPMSIIPLNNRVSKDCISIKTAEGTGPIVEKKLNDFMEKTLKSSEFGIVKVEDQRSYTNRQTYIPLGIVGSIALFLMVNIVLGLFGILRYNISKRVPEIGLRKALGASSSKIRAQFTGEMMTLAVLAAAVALVFAVQVPFFTVLPFSLGLYYGAIALSCLLIFTLVYLCSWGPSHQAAGILPAKALHEE